jgi:transcriptional regulator with XRE-family HTH domain
MYSAIGNYVRERRQDLGLSQEQLAERVGGTYGQSDISRIERGHIELPRLATMVSLAASLEVPVGDLLIASGWFNEEHFVSLSTSSSDADNGKLEAVLAEIEGELDEIRDLERQAEARARKLSAMIRDLKATAGLSVSMVMAAD